MPSPVEKSPVLVADDSWKLPPPGTLPKGFDVVAALSNREGLLDPLGYLQNQANGVVLRGAYLYRCGEAIADRCSRPRVPRKMQVERIVSDCQNPVDPNLSAGLNLGKAFKELGLQQGIRAVFSSEIPQGYVSPEQASRLGWAVGTYLFNVKGTAWYCPVDDDDKDGDIGLPSPVQLWDMAWRGLRGWHHNLDLNYGEMPEGPTLLGMPKPGLPVDAYGASLLIGTLAVYSLEAALHGKTRILLQSLILAGPKISMLPLTFMPAQQLEPPTL